MSNSEISDYQILRYLQEQSDPEENEKIREWLSRSEENRKSFLYLKSIWHVYRANYYADQDNLEKSLSSYQNRINKINRKKFIMKVIKYIVIILALTGLSWLVLRKTVQAGK